MVAAGLTDRRRFHGGGSRDAVLSCESSNCSNVPPAGIQQAPCLGAPIRTAYDGPGRLGEWNTSRNQSRNRRRASSGYGAYTGTRILAKYPICTSCSHRSGLGAKAPNGYSARPEHRVAAAQAIAHGSS
jgi:hypothetical protein